ncbi:V-type ATP synthase subunit E family protein [Nanoarchaeota archaeon]
MGLEKVKDEILNNADKNAQSIIAEGLKEADLVLSELGDKTKELEEKTQGEIKNLLAAVERRDIASAKFEAKRMILDKKKELIDEAFEKAKQNIANLESGKNRQIVKDLIKKAKLELPDIKTIYANKKDKANVTGLNFREIDIIGGIIAENSDASIRVDYSFDTLLEDMKEKELQNISEMLFK